MKKTVILFIVLNILDCVTTYIGVTQGLLEGNILLSSIFQYNIWLGLAVKMLLAVGVTILLLLAKKKKLFKPLNIAFTCIVVWNLLLIFLNIIMK